MFVLRTLEPKTGRAFINNHVRSKRVRFGLIVPKMAPPTIDDGIVQLEDISELRLRYLASGSFISCVPINVEDCALIYAVSGVVR